MVKVLLVSPSAQLEARVNSMLVESWVNQYQLITIDKIEDDIPLSDICLFDEDALPADSSDFLAKYSYLLSPRPLIYVMNSEPEGTAEFKAVKSLTADYLIKDNLSSSGLHNTIRYALENTELKLELEQQQKRYTSLFYNAVEPAFFLDRNLTVTGVNEAFLKTFGISSSDASHRKFYSFLASEKSGVNLKKKLLEFSDSGIDGKLNFKTINDESEFLGHLRVSPITESVLENGELVNRTIAYHGTLKNISHHERLRDVKEKSEKVAMTYRLARTMAHEIRNPLTNINLAIDQLKDETKENEDLDLYFGIVERCTKRIDNILGQLLTSSEKQAFKKSTFDVVKLFKSVLVASKDRSSLEGVEILSKFTTKSAMLEGDKERLKIAFTNLFTNAIESMDKEERTIECGTHLDAHYLCIYVRDNGMGMDEKQLESLFDPFYTSKKSGVGLGLTSTQTIISEHQGQIEVNSEQGIGSQFTIYLPLNSEKV